MAFIFSVTKYIPYCGSCKKRGISCIFASATRNIGMASASGANVPGIVVRSGEEEKYDVTKEQPQQRVGHGNCKQILDFLPFTSGKSSLLERRLLHHYMTMVATSSCVAPLFITINP
jgi:hypothetical protein